MTDYSFLAERICFEHSEYERHQRTAIEHAIKCGEALIEAKQRVGHGEWIKWVDAHLPFTDRTARRYMQIARNRTRVADLDSVRQALAELADPGDDEPEDKTYEIRSSALPLGFVRWEGTGDPKRGLFAWMVPWVAQCPCCGSVEVYPEPAETPEPVRPV